MSDVSGTSAAPAEAQAPVEAGSGPETGGQPAPQQGGGNPNYDSIRSKLGPSFSLVENDLKEMDRLAQERITRSNAEAERYSKLGDFDSLSQAYTLNQRLNENPVEVYNLLAQYLQQQGMLPAEAQQAAAEALDDENGVEVGDSPQDQQLAQLAQAQQQMQDFLQQQQQAQVEAQVEQELDTQMRGIREANPHFTDADEQRIYRFAYASALANEGEPDLDAAVAELNALRTELLSAPRAGDSAPRLVPTTGGLPARGDTPSYGQQSRQQTQQSVVELLRANKAALGQ